MIDREAVVERDLGNVMPPIVAHGPLEQDQLVIVSAKDSTVVDARGEADRIVSVLDRALHEVGPEIEVRP